MKSLFLTRHAKSSWNHVGLSDIERPLNSRGEKAAPFMGQLIYEKSDIPDLLIFTSDPHLSRVFRPIKIPILWSIRCTSRSL